MGGVGRRNEAWNSEELASGAASSHMTVGPWLDVVMKH